MAIGNSTELKKIREKMENEKRSYEQKLETETDPRWRERIQKLLAELNAKTPEQELEQRAESQRSELERKEKAERERRHENWLRIVGERGRRYAGCTLDNFRCDHPRQRESVESMREYASQLHERVTNGDGVVLFGPPGTGKDHLLMALVMVAIRDHGLSVMWRNGLDLFADFRRSINDDSEHDLVRPLIGADILAISDPIPPFGAVTEYQAGSIARIIDSRYSHCRPTWITVNTANRDEANQRLGSQAIDRLSHGALVLHCDWPTYRAPRNRESRVSKTAG